MKKKVKSHRIAASDDIEVSTYLGLAKELRGEQPVVGPKLPPTERETIVVLDFGSQYSMLIARRVRECHVYCELVPYDTPWEKIASLNPRAFILSGGPASVYDSGAPLPMPYIYESRLPVMGICYGMFAIAYHLGGQVTRGTKREYGHTILHISAEDCPLLAGLPSSFPVWMSHVDEVIELPPGFNALAYTENSPFAVIGKDNGIYGLQFHPEVVHTAHGKAIFQNFVLQICGCQGNWTPANFIAESVDKIREQVGGRRVVCALSGGVDSAVAATLIDRAIGNTDLHLHQKQMTSHLTTLLRHSAALAWTCFAITMKADAASDRILFDFQTAINQPAWQIVNDDVMGGVSTSRFQVLTNGGAVFSGVVSLENNGGFASVRSQAVRVDLADCDSFLLRVRGDGRRYKFSVRTETGMDTPLYQCAFTTKRGEWEEHRLPFKDFVPTIRGRILADVPTLKPAKVTSVGFLISDKQDGPFQLEVAWIKASSRAGR